MSAITILIILAVLAYLIFIGRFIYKIILNYDNCNPIKTSGWVFAVIFFPVIGILAYIIVGRNLHKKRSVFESLRCNVEAKAKPQYGFNFEHEAELPAWYQKQKNLLIQLSHLPVFPGNAIEFYTTGQDLYDHMFHDIEQAKNHIHLSYYTFAGDEIGTQLRNLLVKKRKEGLEVRLVYDDIGCNETKSSFFKNMAKEGIDIANFTPVKFFKFIRRINYRNHKKIVVIDGKIGYTGGMNVKDEYVKGVSWGVWKDTHVRVEGPGAQALQTAFITDWYYTKKEFLHDKKYFPEIKNCGNAPLHYILAEPLGQFANIMMGMVEGIARAERSIYIETPYFVPTDSIITALQTSALSGVEIHFVLPGRSDNLKVHYATKSYIQQLLCCGIHVYRYNAGFIHSKLMVVDDELTIVGSSNMDIRSFELNFEGSLFIYDKETAGKAKEIILKDISDSKLMIEKKWEKRPERKKFVEAFFRLFSPFM